MKHQELELRCGEKFTMTFVERPIKQRHCEVCGKLLMGLSICIGTYKGDYSRFPTKFVWVHLHHTPRRSRRWIARKVRSILRLRAEKRMGVK